MLNGVKRKENIFIDELKSINKEVKCLQVSDPDSLKITVEACKPLLKNY